MSAFEELLFEIYIRAFGDPILGIIVFMVIFAGAMFVNRVPGSAALPISYVLVAGILIQMPDSQYFKPVQAVLLMGAGVLLAQAILILAKRR